MPEVTTLPIETIRALDLHDGEQAEAHLDVLNGTATISIVSRTRIPDKVSSLPKALPDLEAELRVIYGEKVIPGANPVLEER